MLDPFCGTGTTGAVAKKLGRRFVGCERDANYAKAAEKRIAATKPLEAPALAPFVTAREAPRVPFSALIERGPGDARRQAGRRQEAPQGIGARDGAVAFEGQVGSIHKMGAFAQGLEACNGWTFWHVETPKGLKLIDELRAQVPRRDGGKRPE